MKKGRVLNPQLSEVIARMGHTDGLVIADCGLPIPEHVERIDLALTARVPSFMQTLEVILSELHVEGIVLAEEIKINNPDVLVAIESILPGIPVEWVSHEVFKRQTEHCKAIVRTGECSPYANIILKSGVVF